MREITDLEEIKSLQLGVLSKIHDFCYKNNLTYFLACGTLIGAVRHNGYIPWDDDIDIVMKRKDYEKFIHCFNDENYGVYSCTTNKNYCWSYAKVFDKRTIKIENKLSKKLNCGIDVDVFVLDDCCDVDFAFKKEKKRKFIQELWYLSIRDYSKVNSFKKMMANCATFILSRFSNYLAKKMNNLSMRDIKTKNESAFLQSLSITGSKIHIFEKKWFEKPVLHRFETYEFYIPNGYDEVLREGYGDYMVLPPTEQQITHHHNKVYWKE